MSRILNLIFGPIYLIIAASTLIGALPFYQLIVVVEIIVLLHIVWIAARWPRQDDRVDGS